MSELIIIEAGKRYRFTVKFRKSSLFSISTFGYDSHDRDFLLWDIDKNEYLSLDIDSSVTVSISSVDPYSTFVCLKVYDIIKS